MSIASDKRKDLDVPKNVQIYTVDRSGHVIPLVSDLSGQLSVDVTIGDIIAIVSGSITVTSGLGVLISGQVISLQSGTSVKISGEKITLGKTPLYDWIFSGYGATNTMVYSGVGFIADKEAALLIYNIGGGSGINYTVRGYLVSGILPYTLVSGTVNSGSTTVYTVTDPYSWIEVGTANTQADFSGVVTVVAARV